MRTNPHAKPGSLDLMVVDVAGRPYGVPAAAVAGIHRMPAVSPAPGGPAGLDGVVDVHGELVPVVDAAAWLGLASRGATADDHLVVLAVAGRSLALRVDRAVEVVRVPAGDVGPPPFAAAGPAARYVRRLDGLLPVVDPAALAEAVGGPA